MNGYCQKKKIINCTPWNENRDVSHLHFDTDSIFSQETLNGLEQLGATLRTIHNRLINEEYSIIDGKLYSPNGQLLYERKSTPTTK